MERPVRFASFASLALVFAIAASALALMGSTCGNSACECFPCTAAIDLSVTDVDGNPLDDWAVEATVDGDQVFDINTFCDPAVRFPANACSFGSQTGVYRITIRQAGFQTRELAARFAAQSGVDCCQSCVASTIVVAVLEAEGAE